MRIPRGKSSIKTRLSIYIAATVVVVSALMCAAYLSWEWEERKADIREHVRWMAANAALISEEKLAEHDTDALRKIAKTIMGAELGLHVFETEEVEAYIEVLDAEGNPIVTEVFGMSDEDIEDMRLKRAEAAKLSAPAVWFDRMEDGCGLYGAVHPVMLANTKIGAVSVSVCDTPAVSEIKENIRDTIGLLMVAGLVGVLVGRKISVKFSGPLAELVKGAGELSSGNLDYRVELDSYREMQILASSFNTMAWSLKEKMESLDDSRKEALNLSEKLARSFEDAKLNAEKLEKLNEWSTDLAFSLEEANQLLKQEMVQTETIVHSIKDGIVALDKNEDVILMNPEAEEIFGIRSEDVKGKNVKLLVDLLVNKIEEPETFLKKFMASTASPDAESEFTITMVRPYRRVIRRHSSAIRSDGGDVIGRVVSLVDITRQKELDDMKTNFVSTVSHELRTPLTSIKGALTLLSDMGMESQEETRREFLSIAEQNVDRLIGLITNLLDLARMESGMVSLNLSRFDLNELVRDLVRSAGIQAARYNVTIDLESFAGNSEVIADREKIGQVVTNLLDNALKFTPPGSHVRVTTKAEDDELTLRVDDEGPGIPRDKLDKVFEKFYQIDMSATRKVGGTGLGLAICKAVINEHGGEIAAFSPVSEGKGTRFEVRLPRSGIYTREKAPPARPAVRKDKPARSGTGSRDTILVVDDDPDFLKMQRKAFEREGYKVVTAATGKDALIFARDYRPGFILMDVRLPDLDGITVSGILKRDPETRDIPIVFATGQLEDGDMRALELGVRIIKKPFEEKELISVVRDYLA